MLILLVDVLIVCSKANLAQHTGKTTKHICPYATATTIGQICKGDSRTCAIFTQHAAQIGVFRFSHYQNIHGSSGAYHVTCILCVKKTHTIYCTVHKYHSLTCFTFVFACEVGKTQKTPIWAPWLVTPLHRMVVYKD